MNNLCDEKRRALWAMRRIIRTCLFARCLLLCLGFAGFAWAAPEDYFGIQVVDAETGRGVPLITLTSVNHQSWVTDSAGWIAFQEPGLMETEVFFHISGPGYSIEKDGFGYAGVRFIPKAGKKAEVRVKRENIAERLYRVTGQGIYRDSLLLGLDKLLDKESQKQPALVLGQDSVQTVPWQGKLFWLWGDTNFARYPLGNFHVTCAWSDFPGKAGLDPSLGLSLDYIRQENGQIRPMMPMKAAGAVWIFGLMTVPDAQKTEHLVGHYGRFESLTKRAEHGIAEYDSSLGQFRSLTQLEPNTWQHPEGNAVRVQNKDGDHCYFTESFPLIRVKAQYEEVLNPAMYRAFTWSEAAQSYHWQSEQGPMTQEEEKRRIQAGKLPASAARFQVSDAVTGQEVKIHRACVNWNAYRQRWIMIATQKGGSISQIGEIWYAEAPTPEGPWRKAVKIATHPRYSFYNPRHHAFFDQEDGRIIYFEGTYTESFSGNPVPTPRYDYNQIMYRLDLADPRLSTAHEADK